MRKIFLDVWATQYHTDFQLFSIIDHILLLIERKSAMLNIIEIGNGPIPRVTSRLRRSRFVPFY